MIDKLYFVQRDYTFGRAQYSAEVSNNDLWKGYLTNTDVGKAMLPYLKDAYIRSFSDRLVDRNSDEVKSLLKEVVEDLKRKHGEQWVKDNPAKVQAEKDRFFEYYKHQKGLEFIEEGNISQETLYENMSKHWKEARKKYMEDHGAISQEDQDRIAIAYNKYLEELKVQKQVEEKAAGKKGKKLGENWVLGHQEELAAEKERIAAEILGDKLQPYTGLEIPISGQEMVRMVAGRLDTPMKGNDYVWADYYMNSPEGRIMYKYLNMAWEMDNKYDINNIDSEIIESDRKDLYKYWEKARQLMIQANKYDETTPAYQRMPVASIPETASEAFEKFLYTRKTSKGEFKYIELTSKYNEGVPLLEQTQEAINNLLFDFYQARLEDYDTFKERYTPGGPTQLKEALPIMMALNYATDKELSDCVRRETQGALEALLDLAKKYKGFTPNYDPTEPATLAHYQTYNAIYDKLIGVAANQNINQRLTALLSVMRLKSPIQFGSILEAKDKDKAGSDVKARVVNGIDTELLNTEFLSSAVDAVKNALLEYYGIDDNNFNMACLLSKIGASPTDIGLLLNQPVVKKAMLIMKESDYYMSLSDALAEALQSPEFMGVEAYRLKIAELNSSFSKTEGAGKTKEARNKHVTSDALANHIAYSKKVPNIKSPEHEAYLIGQAAVVHLLSEINGAASELSDVIKISKATSANSIQATLGAFEAAQKAIEQFEANFGGPNSMFEVEINGEKMWEYDEKNNTWKKKYGIGLVSASLGFYDLNSAYDLLDQVLANPFCIEQVAFAAQAHFINTVIDSLFPYRSQGFMAVKNAMSALTKKGTLPAELITTLNRDLMAAFMEYICPEMSGSAMENVLMPDGSTVQVERRIFYQQFFPYFYNMLMAKNAKEVAESKTKFSPDQNPVMPYIAFAILKNIKKVNDVQIRGVDSATGLGHLLLKFTGSSMLKKHQVDMMIDSWEQLYFSGDPMLKQLAEQLAYYSIFNKGFGYGELSFLRFAPVMLKKNLAGGAYAKFFNRVFNLKEGDEPGTLTIAQTGSNSSTTIRIKDIMKSFILNNSNEYQFTRQYLNDRLFEAIATHTPGGYELRDAFDATSAKAISKEEFSQRIKSFTVDLNNEDIKKNGGNSLAVTILNEDGEVVGYKFTPCIKIGDAIYICDINLNGNDTEFTTSGNGKITYYKMDLPLGKDYSKPGLYGTREAHIAEVSGNNIDVINQIRTIAEATIANLEVTEHEAGEDNFPLGVVIQEMITTRMETVKTALKALMTELNKDKVTDMYKHLQVDFISSIQELFINSIFGEKGLLGTLIKSIDKASTDITKRDTILKTINERVELFLTQSFTEYYVAKIELAMTSGIVVFDFETTSLLNEAGSGLDTGRNGIALIGAFAIKNGKITVDIFGDRLAINMFVTELPGHKVPSAYNSGPNPIYLDYIKAKREGRTVDEAVALLALNDLMAEYGYTLGYNSIGFDHAILSRRLNALQIKPATTNALDVLTMARLALFNKDHLKVGLNNLKRESVVAFLSTTSELFRLDLASMKLQLGAEHLASHDAFNDIIETYCIMKNLLPRIKHSNVITSTMEFRKLGLALKAVADTINRKIGSIEENTELVKQELEQAKKAMNEEINNIEDQQNLC